ncbi:MAG: LysE family translocator [Ramlibacter sp.]|nr:LysE family translocator [Ramlibacter sp.]
MAAVSSAGVGLLIRSSPPLFTALKYCGVSYLFYLAYKAWRRPTLAPVGAPAEQVISRAGLLIRGALLQTSNPKSLLFFLSVLPQLVESRDASASQMARLVVAIGIYCVALLVIHAMYAGAAARARRWLMKPSATRLLSRLSAVVFLGFGVGMLTLNL